jgi:uracil-DNA glycosylase
MDSIRLEQGWKERLNGAFSTPSFSRLADFVKQEYRTHTCYPPASQVFAAFDHCPFDKVRVVILGQDPYHGPGQAHGLCFSVNDGVPFPPSLRNIFKEIQSDLGQPVPLTGNLTRWADQGVLLLNAVLTVRDGQPASHQKKGWEEFTDEVIRQVSTHKRNVVFMLWGNYAIRKGSVIDASAHCVLQSAHPSPLSAHQGFLGNRHFSKANAYLKANGLPEIDW